MVEEAISSVGTYWPSTFTTPDVTTCIIAPPGLNAREYEAFQQELREALAQSTGHYLILQAGSEVGQIHATSTEIGVDVWADSTVTIHGYSDCGLLAEQFLDAMFINVPLFKNPAWAMNRITALQIRNLRDGNGRYFVDPSVCMPEKFLGLPIVIDDEIPADTVLLCETIARTNVPQLPNQGFVKCLSCAEYQCPTPSGRCPGCGAGLARPRSNGRYGAWMPDRKGEHD